MKTPHMLRTVVLVVLTLAILLCCSMFPTSVGDTLLQTDSDTVTISREEYEKLKQFEELFEIKSIVDEYYYIEPDQQAMLDMAASGLLYGLDDPYTYYYTPEKFAEMWADDEGEYAGIGIQIVANYKTNLCTISRVFLDSPALECGMRRGDILVKVEDLIVTAQSLQDAVNIMRGEVGKSVHVEVLRGEETIGFDITRAQVHVNWVNSCMLENDIGYISLYEFSGDCAIAFEEHLNTLMAQNPRALILDLRDNPGGWVNAAQSIADLFLPQGIVTYLQYRDGSTEYYRTSTDNHEINIPLVLLVNENSASSSEILSGCLQDRGRATIVGVQTYGKGIVQYVLDVGNRGAGMQLTIARYFTPNGNEVHKIGITPDVISEMPEGDNNMYALGDLNDKQLADAYAAALSLVEE